MTATSARRRRPWAAAIVAALAVTVPACGGDGADETSAGDGVGEAVGAADTTTTIATTTTTTATTSPSTTTVAGAQLTIAEVVATDTAPVANDACSQPVAYDATNMIDGLGDSAWRTAGDASGQTLTFRLGTARRVLAVAVLPGYAKVDPCDGADRWAENRRPTSVTWTFDDGSQVAQPLTDSATVQKVSVDTTTTTVSLRIDGVTANPARDFTAITEVAVLGV